MNSFIIWMNELSSSKRFSCKYSIVAIGCVCVRIYFVATLTFYQFDINSCYFIAASKKPIYTLGYRNVLERLSTTPGMFETKDVEIIQND